MIITWFDRLFYYMTYWFEKNKEKLRWSTPAQRTSYALGLMTLGLSYSVNKALEYNKITLFPAKYGIIIALIFGLGAMQLYEYIYITKSRYEDISLAIYGKTNISDDTGAIIAMMITVLGMGSPFIAIELTR